MSRFVDRVLAGALAAAFVLGCAGIVGAQAVKGGLLGNVVDQSGQPMPGVTVTITEVSTNISLHGSDQRVGYYVFANLKDGTYRVAGELTGFKRAVRDGVDVPVNATQRVDLKLEIGAIEESVTVVGSSPLLQTDRADTSRIIESVHLTEVPLGFNRNFQGMMVTVPGALKMQRPHSDFFNAQDSLSTNVNGQSRLANNVQIEGIDDNHRTGLLTTLIPSAEAIETVNISTSAYDAEFGRARRSLERRRQAQREARALPDGAGAADGAVVLVNDPVGDRQAQSGAAADRFRGEERVVDPRQVLGGNARSRVGHLGDGAIAVDACRDRQPATPRHRVARVEEQVQEHLLQLMLDAEDLHGRGGQLSSDLDLCRRELMLEEREHVGDHRIEIHGRSFLARETGAWTRQIEQAVHDLRGAEGLPFDLPAMRCSGCSDPRSRAASGCSSRCRSTEC